MSDSDVHSCINASINNLKLSKESYFDTGSTHIPL